MFLILITFQKMDGSALFLRIIHEHFVVDNSKGFKHYHFHCESQFWLSKILIKHDWIID